jgi:conjugative transposon protein
LVLDDNEIVKVNQRNMRASVVKTRFLELREDYLESLEFVLKDHDQEVRNIRAFILTAAYNIPSTIDSYYINKVNYDRKYWQSRDKVINEELTNKLITIETRIAKATANEVVKALKVIMAEANKNKVKLDKYIDNQFKTKARSLREMVKK